MEKMQLFMEMINSMEGLEISFKLGKEAELNIKGNFLKMAEAFTKIQLKMADSNDSKRNIQELKQNIL